MFCIKFSQSRMKGERHRLSTLSLQLHMHSKSNYSQTCSCGLYLIKRYARTYFIIKIVICHLCSWSRKSRSLEDSMAIYRCQTVSQVSLFVGFLILWISLPMKTMKIGAPRIKVISQQLCVPMLLQYAHTLHIDIDMYRYIHTLHIDIDIYRYIHTLN